LPSDALRAMGHTADQSQGAAELTNEQWCQVVAFLPGVLATRARRNPYTYRRFIENVLWVAETRRMWSELDPQSDSWRNTYMRFIRWIEMGVWPYVIAALDETELSIGLARKIGEFKLDRARRQRRKRHDREPP